MSYTLSVLQNFQTPLNQLQSRIWLMHWSLFIFFNHEGGRNGIIDLFLYDSACASAPNAFLEIVPSTMTCILDTNPVYHAMWFACMVHDVCRVAILLQPVSHLFVTLAEKLNMTYDEAERWIVNLVRNSKLDAKIDSKSGTVVMEPNHVNVYEQIIENTKALSLRTYKYANLVLESAQVQTAV
ncbi:hypothetical protein IFM89_017333 [Coptis chinensis]|uniref:PCI domain-containing protein n=1 Tax=Coptis chinensis TaxID=261450 RepID=A0A835LEQ0_9MAGN|nr:hypothetical protein IFM89_017333 [Coptis chinensis]